MKQKFLIVEDDEVLCELLKVNLPDEAFSVDVAYDTRQAYKFLKKSIYDIILLDLKLHGDGFNIIKKEKLKEKSTRLFIITGNPLMNLTRAEKNLLKAAEHIFIKPFEMEELLEKISKPKTKKVPL